MAGTCEGDADCRCFPGGISEKHACGGVTDAKTQAKLTSLASDYNKKGCMSGLSCAAFLCEPTCRAGRCANLH